MELFDLLGHLSTRSSDLSLSFLCVSEMVQGEKSYRKMQAYLPNGWQTKEVAAVSEILIFYTE